MLTILTDCWLLMLTKNLLVRNKLILGMAIGWTAIITYYSLVNSSEIPSMPLNFDKLGHIAFHFGLTLSWFLYFKTRKSNMGYRKAAIKAFLLSLFYGILIEVCQGLFTTTRQADFKDVFANTFGSILVIFLVYLIKQYSKSRK